VFLGVQRGGLREPGEQVPAAQVVRVRYDRPTQLHVLHRLPPLSRAPLHRLLFVCRSVGLRRRTMISGVCSVGLRVRALKEKRVELSTPNLYPVTCIERETEWSEIEVRCLQRASRMHGYEGSAVGSGRLGINELGKTESSFCWFDPSYTG